MRQTERKRDKERDRRERWEGRTALHPCMCSECHCSKNPQLFLLNMHICPLHAIHNGTALFY